MLELFARQLVVPIPDLVGAIRLFRRLQKDTRMQDTLRIPDLVNATQG